MQNNVLIWDRKGTSGLVSECGTYAIFKQPEPVNTFTLYRISDKGSQKKLFTSSRRKDCQEKAQDLENAKLTKVRKCWVQGCFDHKSRWVFRLIGVTYSGEITYCMFLANDWLRQNRPDVLTDGAIHVGSASIALQIFSEALAPGAVELAVEAIGGY